MILIDGKNVNTFMFPGGEVNPNVIKKGFHSDVTAILKDSKTIMELLMVANALNYKIDKLEIPYIPYARQDRICNTGEAFSIKVMADLINSIGAKQVIGWDVHSDVTSALINNFLNIPQEDILGYDIELGRILLDKKYCICSPDAGSLKKIHKIQNTFRIPNDRLVLASKERDVKTGYIINTTVDFAPKQVLIIDDICDGGRTFVELAKVLKAKGTEKVHLYVTHGIFSKGIDVFDGLIDHIWTTDSFCDIKHDKLTIIRRLNVQK